MILDLTSTIVGSLGTIIIIFLFMLWVVMSAGKEANERLANGNHCPSGGEKEACNEHECRNWKHCEPLEKIYAREWRA